MNAKTQMATTNPCMIERKVIKSQQTCGYDICADDVRSYDRIKHQHAVKRHGNGGCGHEITLNYECKERNLRKSFPQTVVVDQHDIAEENHWQREVREISEALPDAHDAERRDWRKKWA